jgi:hypothetical protein
MVPMVGIATRVGVGTTEVDMVVKDDDNKQK